MKSLTATGLALLALSAQPGPPEYRWTPQVSGVTARLRGVSAVSDRDAWASGANGTLIHTRSGGSAWERVTIPETDRLDFRDVDGIDETTAYVLSIGAGSASRIYKTSDWGTTWTLQFTNQEPKGFFDAMAFWDERSGLVMGDSIDGHFDILRTMDGGAHWTRVAASGLPDALPNEGAFAGSGTNVAVGAHGEAWIGTGAAARCRVLHSKDYGATWTLVETPVAGSASAGIFSIAFRDPQNGITVGGDYRKEGEAVDNAAVTRDGGRTWVKIGGLSGFRSVVAPLPSAPGAWLAVGPSGADATIDDGRTWNNVSTVGYHTLSIARASGHVGWAAGESGRIAKVTW